MWFVVNDVNLSNVYVNGICVINVNANNVYVNNDCCANESLMREVGLA